MKSSEGVGNIPVSVNNKNHPTTLLHGTLTGHKYFEFLCRYIVSLLTRTGDMTVFDVWFQQDGAPAHYKQNVRNFLNKIFPNQWVGPREFIE